MSDYVYFILSKVLLLSIYDLIDFHQIAVNIKWYTKQTFLTPNHVFNGIYFLISLFKVNILSNFIVYTFSSL